MRASIIGTIRDKVVVFARGYIPGNDTAFCGNQGSSEFDYNATPSSGQRTTPNAVRC